MSKQPAGAYVIVALTALVLAVVAVSIYLSEPAVADDATGISFSPTRESVDKPIQPIPRRIMLDEARVELGQHLFKETRLSGDNTVSCATCHDLENGGVDGLPVSIGINGETGFINTPTIFNTAYNFRQYWDGRAATLEAQIDGPIHNTNEMGSNWDDIIARLATDDVYVASFTAIYEDGITADNIKDAIATYQRSLITPGAPFDEYLRGDETALTDEELAGYTLFRSYGCVSCHQGVNVGGNLYQRFGVMADYFEDRGDITPADLGRYNVTGREEDRHVFKVPTLRNIALTAPYFHDASAETLHDAVHTMGYYQLGLNLSDEDVDLLVAFLHTLTGEQPYLPSSETPGEE